MSSSAPSLSLRPSYSHMNLRLSCLKTPSDATFDLPPFMLGFRIELTSSGRPRRNWIIPSSLILNQSWSNGMSPLLLFTTPPIWSSSLMCIIFIRRSWWFRLGAFIAPNKYVPLSIFHFTPSLANYNRRSLWFYISSRTIVLQVFDRSIYTNS